MFVFWNSEVVRYSGAVIELSLWEFQSVHPALSVRSLLFGVSINGGSTVDMSVVGYN